MDFYTRAFVSFYRYILPLLESQGLAGINTNSLISILTYLGSHIDYSTALSLLRFLNSKLTVKTITVLCEIFFYLFLQILHFCFFASLFALKNVFRAVVAFLYFLSQMFKKRNQSLKRYILNKTPEKKQKCKNVFYIFI